MVRWFFKEIDKLYWWSGTGLIDFQCRENKSKRCSDNVQMIFYGKRQVALVVRYWWSDPIQSYGQMTVRWFSRERDKLHLWSDIGQIL